MVAIVTQGDARTLPFPDDSVDLICTSPPYFGLRSYLDGGEHYATQIGSEATPAEFIAALVECTREMMRVLKPSGSIFVNLGDKYSGYNAGSGKGRSLAGERGEARMRDDAGNPNTYGVAAKSLMLLPERYRIACTDELGLIARAVIVWSKPNGLPESVRDRVRRSHEDWVHLTRGPKYFESVDEIREPHLNTGGGRGEYVKSADCGPLSVGQPAHRQLSTTNGNPLGKLPGSVWSIATQPLRVPTELNVDHFAAFPMEWPRRLITGWCPREVCTACGEGRRPVTERESQASTARSMSLAAAARARTTTSSGSVASAASSTLGHDVPRTITGYACACPDTSAPSTPGVVLDPFGGTGTTALVADVLGRVGISLDASADYGRIAEWRTQDPKQRERAGRGSKPVEAAPLALFGT